MESFIIAIECGDPCLCYLDGVFFFFFFFWMGWSVCVEFWLLRSISLSTASSQHFAPKKLRFLQSVEAFRYIMFDYCCVQNISCKFLFGKIIVYLSIHYVNIINIMHSGLCNSTNSKTCIIHTRKLRIDLKFENKLILSIDI